MHQQGNSSSVLLFGAGLAAGCSVACIASYYASRHLFSQSLEANAQQHKKSRVALGEDGIAVKAQPTRSQSSFSDSKAGRPKEHRPDATRQGPVGMTPAAMKSHQKNLPLRELAPGADGPTNTSPIPRVEAPLQPDAPLPPRPTSATSVVRSIPVAKPAPPLAVPGRMEAAMTDELEEACAMLVECIDLRKKWLFQPAITPEKRSAEPEAATPADVTPIPLQYTPMPATTHSYEMVDGVMHVYADENSKENLFEVPGNAAEFFTSMNRILRYAALGPVKSLCHHRLMLLEQKFNLHVMLNTDKEFLSQKAAPHRDFYNVRKVDTHIHHSACMHQKHLLRFIKSKLRKEPDEVVIFRDGKYLTLKEVFESLNLTGYDLNVDTLDMHADKSLFHRFDRFNLKYNPFGQSRLREIFIKQDNLIHGRFLAELTKEVFNDLESSKYQHAEMRVSIYGRKAMEWDILASWVAANELFSNNNVWLIQIPRLYNVYKNTGVIENFQQMLDNIFEPLFAVTKDPASHPQLHVYLSQVVGFDMVDDESKPERRPTKHCPPPADWNSKHNCAYSYYAYYVYANLYVLNKFRESRGLNTFSFRPHAGEAGDVDHLASAFMLCENIAHGINLRKSPMLQYLYYLAQIGLCMSPLSNNTLFLDYHKNPFPAFFARGLSVSLSTDDPLQIHLTKEPLVEEYSVAAQVWKMSSADLCEIARYGVLHSGYPHACKKHWVAAEYWRPGPDGNDIHKTNVPNLRLRFRYDTYMDEMRLVAHGALAYNLRKSS
ncbi:hypothetical protein DUNSADRAFT_10599 [Dunaliella salina]|uniref:AMP deaminase n=1 Tax=Dunaliella salina TaxID=3046 RepID=A0ABQ7GF03_DUNSA|nr:hypothetical protein DUNSADRAFT_10599 [Dunaliella salina]|eukprot:KAF5833185.1 hypothetical protein DUNSADRAFT_10599 [Dunaliella salina]